MKSGTASLSASQAYGLGQEAYIYLYPLVTMDLTRRQATNMDAGRQPGYGPMNAFSHLRTYPDPNLKMVVRPNFDTLYSLAWLDLSKEPMILSVPDTAGRHYLLPILDMWTDIFAAPGKRTTGTESGQYAIVPPGWRGELPPDLTRIDAPTPYVWVLGRTQTNGPQDYEAVHQVQDGFRLTPLASRGQETPPATVEIDPDLDMETPPLEQVNAMSAASYFTYAAELMRLQPPHPTDWSTLARIKRIGLEPGKSFDFDRLDPEVKQALERAVNDSVDALRRVGAPRGAGWQRNAQPMGVYGNDYLKRAFVTMLGLGANQPEDVSTALAFVDADEKPLNGDNNYVLSFDKETLPPVDAFWTVTVYDQEGFAIPNPQNRFALGSHSAAWHYDADGSLNIYLQHESPGHELEGNWLPTPRAPFNLTMRLYAARPPALNGQWAPPAVERVE